MSLPVKDEEEELVSGDRIEELGANSLGFLLVVLASSFSEVLADLEMVSLDFHSPCKLGDDVTEIAEGREREERGERGEGSDIFICWWMNCKATWYCSSEIIPLSLMLRKTSSFNERASLSGGTTRGEAEGERSEADISLSVSPSSEAVQQMLSFVMKSRVVMIDSEMEVL